MEPEEFIDWLDPHARRYQERWMLPAAVAVAQAALETGWGRAIRGNNLFGIKARKGQPSQVFTTHEVIDGKRVKLDDRFRVFDTIDDAFDGLAIFILENPRYAGAVAARRDPEAFTDALARAGYATDPLYATKIRSIMRRYLLVQRFGVPVG